MKKRIIALLLCLMMLVSLCACTSKQDKKNEEAVLRIGTLAEHSGFNLFSQGGAYGKLNLERFGQEPLIGMDETGEITPGFFQKYDINEENNQVVLTFPTNAKFHDGTTITVDDVLFSMDAWNKMWKNRGYNVTVTDHTDSTITVSLDTNSAYSWLSYGAGQCFIAPKHVWENVEGSTSSEYANYTGEDAVIGAGPYKFVSYDEEAGVSYYEAFEDYFNGAPNIKYVELHSYANAETLCMALKTGEIDAMYAYANPVSSTVIDVLRGVDNVDIGQSDYTGNYQLVFGFKAEVTSDQAFRDATYYALDYELLATTIGGEEATVAHKGMIPASNKGYVDTYPLNERNLEKANQILDEAGYLDVDGDGIREDKEGKKMVVSILPQSGKNGMMTRLAEVMIGNLKDVGVVVEIDEEAVRNTDIFNQRTKVDQNYQLYVGYTTSGVADYRTSAFYVLPKPYYQSGTFDDPEYVAAYQELQAANNIEAYNTAVAKIQKINAEKLPLIALAWEKAYFPYRTDTFSGFDNWTSTGVINQDCWWVINAK